MLAGPTLFLFLAAAEPADGAGELDLDSAVHAELDECAERIEALKSRQEAGRELDRLLRRAQHLAAELERAAADLPPLPPSTAPSPEELRERADAARDEADRLAGEIATLDVRIQDTRRARGEPGSPVSRAALGTLVPAADPAAALVAQRARLAERRARAVEDAARLEHEAVAAEQVP